MKISSPIQFQLTIIPKSVFLAIKFKKRMAKLSEHNYRYSLYSTLIILYNQSTVETVTVISNIFFKTKGEIKHMHTMGVVVVKICVYLLDVLWPRQHNRGHIEPVNEPTLTVLWQA